MLVWFVDLLCVCPSLPFQTFAYFFVFFALFLLRVVSLSLSPSLVSFSRPLAAVLCLYQSYLSAFSLLPLGFLTVFVCVCRIFSVFLSQFVCIPRYGLDLLSLSLQASVCLHICLPMCICLFVNPFISCLSIPHAHFYVPLSLCLHVCLCPHGTSP